MATGTQLFALAAFLGAITVGLGLLTFEFWDDSDWTPENETCKNFPPGLTKFSIEMGSVLSNLWVENYRFREFGGKIIKGCPAFFPRVDVYIDEHLVARSRDHKIIPRRFDVNDCHSKTTLVSGKRPIFSTDIGDHLPTKINFDLYDSNEKKLADVDGTYWMKQNEMFVTDPNQNNLRIARIHKPDWLSTVWEFEILEPNHPMGDPRILAIIAGRSILIVKTSICNKIFDNTIVFLVVFAIGFLIAVGAWIQYLRKGDKPSEKEEKKD